MSRRIFDFSKPPQSNAAKGRTSRQRQSSNRRPNTLRPSTIATNRHSITKQAKFNPPGDVGFYQRGHVGVVALARPDKYNALTHNMVRRVDSQVQQWQNAPDVSAIIIKAEDVDHKAFCAGGDIDALFAAVEDNDDSAKEFFYDEYTLNSRLKYSPIPIISLLNGITMGGGVGTGCHNQYVVACEKTVFAMPETQIGFIPDVGCTHLLANLPDNIGILLGLTGLRINGADLLDIGIASHFTNHSNLNKIIDTLTDTVTDTNTHEKISEVLDFYSSQPTDEQHLTDHLAIIRHCFRFSSIEKIIEALHDTQRTTETLFNILLKRKPSAQQPAEQKFINDCLILLGSASPESLKLTLQMLSTTREQDLGFNQCLEMEHAVVKQLWSPHTPLRHDFMYGVSKALKKPGSTRTGWETPRGGVKQRYREIIDQAISAKTLPIHTNETTTEESAMPFSR